jgi:hypothetical protein
MHYKSSENNTELGLRSNFGVPTGFSVKLKPNLPYENVVNFTMVKIIFRVRTAPGISLKKNLILNNPEMSLISKQYSANPWNVLEFNKGKI